MRRLPKRRVPRPRLLLHLETLEDRRLLSGGGFLVTLPLLTPVVAAPAVVAPLATTTLDLGGPTSSAVTPAPASTTPIANAGGLTVNLESLLLPIAPVAAVPSPAAPVAVVPSVLNTLLTAPLSLFTPVTTTAADLGGALLGALTQPAASSAPVQNATAGTTSGLNLDLNLGVDLPLVPLDNVPLSVGGGSNTVTVEAGSPTRTGDGGVTLPVLDGATSAGAPAFPLLESSGGAAPIADAGKLITSLNNGQTNALAPVIDPGGGGQAPTAAAPTAAAVVEAPGETMEARTSSTGPTTGLASALLSALILVEPGERPADGAAGSPADPGAAPVAAGAVTVPPTSDGGGAAAAAPAQPADGDGGANLTANLAPEASGLATHFQPFDLGRIRTGLAGLVGRIAPEGGWMAGLLSRLAAWAPWLAALAAGSVAYEVRRRRRRRSLRPGPRAE